MQEPNRVVQEPNRVVQEFNLVDQEPSLVEQELNLAKQESNIIEYESGLEEHELDLRDGHIITLSSSSESEDEESVDDNAWKRCEDLMREAVAELPAHIPRGFIVGVKGTYSSSSINSKPSRTTQWRRRKKNEEIATEKENKEAVFQKDKSRKSLLTHFFRPANQPFPTQGFTMGVKEDKKEKNEEKEKEEGEKEEETQKAKKTDSVENIKRSKDLEKLREPEETRVSKESKEEESEEEPEEEELEEEGELKGSEESGGREETEELEELEKQKKEEHPDEVEYVMRPHVAKRAGQAPGCEEAARAIPVLCEVLKEKRKTKIEYFNFVRLRQMLQLLRLYTLDPIHKGKWIRASEAVALSEGRAAQYGRDMRRWCQTFILDHHTIPRNMHGAWRTSILYSDEDLKLSIIAHLQGLGKYFSASDLLNFLNTPDILDRLGRTKKLSLRTAQRWLKLLGFRWRKEGKGMYSDGHERQDVVDFRQQVFLPKYTAFHKRAAKFDAEGNEELSMGQNGKPVMIHHHDETIFYGNDRRNVHWIHDSESPKPYAKGEGQSLMVADFVSSAIGWLSSPDGLKRSRVVLRPGKARDGYFSCEEVMTQLSTAMDILEQHYPSYQHVFILDNARTHTKRAENALSARKMLKNPHPTFGVSTVLRDTTGKPILDDGGQAQTEKRRIDNATFANGTPQLTYFPSTHPQYPGFFNGMTQLLRERGVENPERLRAECTGFKCAPEAVNCCQRRILFNQPDFRNVPSLVAAHCKTRGFDTLFLPKFHPELNFIEMCWGYSKRLYRETPPATKIEQIEANALSCLDQVPLLAMRR